MVPLLYSRSIGSTLRRRHLALWTIAFSLAQRHPTTPCLVNYCFLSCATASDDTLPCELLLSLLRNGIPRHLALWTIAFSLAQRHPTTPCLVNYCFLSCATASHDTLPCELLLSLLRNGIPRHLALWTIAFSLAQRHPTTPCLVNYCFLSCATASHDTLPCELLLSLLRNGIRRHLALWTIAFSLAQRHPTTPCLVNYCFLSCATASHDTLPCELLLSLLRNGIPRHLALWTIAFSLAQRHPTTPCLVNYCFLSCATASHDTSPCELLLSLLRNGIPRHLALWTIAFSLAQRHPTTPCLVNYCFLSCATASDDTLPCELLLSLLRNGIRRHLALWTIAFSLAQRHPTTPRLVNYCFLSCATASHDTSPCELLLSLLRNGIPRHLALWTIAFSLAQRHPTTPCLVNYCFLSCATASDDTLPCELLLSLLRNGIRRHLALWTIAFSLAQRHPTTPCLVNYCFLSCATASDDTLPCELLLSLLRNGIPRHLALWTIAFSLAQRHPTTPCLVNYCFLSCATASHDTLPCELLLSLLRNDIRRHLALWTIAFSLAQRHPTTPCLVNYCFLSCAMASHDTLPCELLHSLLRNGIPRHLALWTIAFSLAQRHPTTPCLVNYCFLSCATASHDTSPCELLLSLLRNDIPRHLALWTIAFSLAQRHPTTPCLVNYCFLSCATASHDTLPCELLLSLLRNGIRRHLALWTIAFSLAQRHPTTPCLVNYCFLSCATASHDTLPCELLHSLLRNGIRRHLALWTIAFSLAQRHPTTSRLVNYCFLSCATTSHDTLPCELLLSLLRNGIPRHLALWTIAFSLAQRHPTTPCLVNYCFLSCATASVDTLPCELLLSLLRNGIPRHLALWTIAFSLAQRHPTTPCLVNYCFLSCATASHDTLPCELLLSLLRNGIPRHLALWTIAFSLAQRHPTTPCLVNYCFLSCATASHDTLPCELLLSLLRNGIPRHLALWTIAFSLAQRHPTTPCLVNYCFLSCATASHDTLPCELLLSLLRNGIRRHLALWTIAFSLAQRHPTTPCLVNYCILSCATASDDWRRVPHTATSSYIMIREALLICFTLSSNYQNLSDSRISHSIYLTFLWNYLMKRKSD